jgi:hypothetical protein
MANSGVPSGGNYPSRQELSALLKPFLESTSETFDSLTRGNASSAASELNVDRRFLYGKQVNRIYQDQVNSGDTDAGMMNAGDYYKVNGNYYEDAQTVTQRQLNNAVNGDVSLFVEWEVPTSSTNYEKPRTVAAGYTPDPSNPANGTMTVVFRDGTFYNYYKVSPTEWEAFHASYSKGKPWLNRKNKNQASDGLFINKPRGNAGDMNNVSPQIREALYRVARSAQIKTKPKKGRTIQKVYKTKPRTANYYGLEDSPKQRRPSMNVPNRLKKDISQTRGGTNPSRSAGRNPYKKAS